MTINNNCENHNIYLELHAGKPRTCHVHLAYVELQYLAFLSVMDIQWNIQGLSVLKDTI